MVRFGDAYDLRTVALSRLTAMAQEELKPNFEPVLREAGGETKWLLELARDFPGWDNSREDLAEFLDQHPDSAPLHAGLLVRQQSSTSSIFESAYRRSFDLLKESHPGLALVAAFHLADVAENNADTAKILERALDELPVAELGDLSTLNLALRLEESVGPRCGIAIQIKLEEALERMYQNFVGNGEAGGERYIALAKELPSDIVLAPRWEAEALLKVANLSDARISSQKNLRSYVDELIPRLLERDAELARKVYWKLCDLVKREIAAGTWHHRFYNGYTLPSDLLYRVVDEAENLQALTFAVRLMAEDERSEICSSFGFRFRFYEPIRDLFEESGGLDEMPRSLHQTLLRLDQARTNHPVPILSAAFHYWMLKTDESQRYRFLEWADEQATSDHYPELAIELGMVLRRITAEEREEGPNADLVVADADAWQKHYLEILRRDDIPFNQRVQVAWDVLRHLRFQVGSEFTLAATRLVGEAWRQDATFTSGLAEYILYEFCLLPDSDAWREAAEVLMEGWQRQCDRGYLPENGTYDFDPVKDTVVSMLGIYLRAGSEGERQRFLADHAPKLAGDARVFVSLVQYRTFSEAAEFVSRHWRQIGDTHEKDLYFNEALERAIPEFLAQIEDDGLRYLSAVLLAVVEDLPSILGGPQVSGKNERMRILANDYAKTPFTTDAMKERALYLLAGASATWPLLFGPLEQAYDPSKFDHVVSSHLSSAKMLHELRLPAAYICQKAREGDAKPLTDMVARVTALSESTSYRRYAIANLGVWFQKSATESLDQFDPDGSANWESCAEAYSALIKVDEDLRDDTWGRLVSAQMAHHAIRGKISELATWRETELSDDDRRRLKTGFARNYPVFSSVRLMIEGSQRPIPLEERQQIVTQLAQDEWFRRDYRRIRTLPEYLVMWKVFSREELLEFANPWHAILAGHRPDFAIGLASLVDKSDSARAATLLRLELEKIDDVEEKREGGDEVRIRLAEILLRSGQAAESAEVLRPIDLTKADGEVQSRRKQILTPFVP